MEVSVSHSGRVSTLSMSGRFDALSQKTFLTAVGEAVVADSSEVRLDFGGVNYIDSTALGLLLVAREQAKRAGKVVSIANASGSVKLVLDVANFDKIFPVYS